MRAGAAARGARSDDKTTLRAERSDDRRLRYSVAGRCVLGGVVVYDVMMMNYSHGPPPCYKARGPGQYPRGRSGPCITRGALALALTARGCMAGMPLFAHACREKINPAAPFCAIETNQAFAALKPEFRSFEVLRRRTGHATGLIFFSFFLPFLCACFALQNTQKTRGKPRCFPNFDTPGTRMEIRTWRSAIADLKGSPPGAPSGALGEGTPGWVWRCNAAISRYLSMSDASWPF